MVRQGKDILYSNLTTGHFNKRIDVIFTVFKITDKLFNHILQSGRKAIDVNICQELEYGNVDRKGYVVHVNERSASFFTQTFVVL